uniref:Uncharacterized protein n=1 Tax=Arundo donax TaxID=35708 RepID=A0A0A9CUZ4_ARUDO
MSLPQSVIASSILFHENYSNIKFVPEVQHHNMIYMRWHLGSVKSNVHTHKNVMK